MKKIEEYIRDYQSGVIPFKELFRQYGEDVREECAKIVEPVDDVLANVIRQNVKIE